MDLVDVEPPYKNWFVDIENRLFDLENSDVSDDDFETVPIDFSSEWEVSNETIQDTEYIDEELVDPELYETEQYEEETEYV